MNEVTSMNEARSRRSFLKLLPLGVLAGVFASIGGAAFRFLRPRIGAVSEAWLDVAALTELKGPQPLARKIIAENTAGWAICPHEGCEVSWDGGANRFSCPCHESYFAADGARISGPASRGLDPLPMRVQDGKVQVQYNSKAQA
jgi:nitrite reductase/ring-hydroxylating ferredoxin subunit